MFAFWLVAFCLAVGCMAGTYTTHLVSPCDSLEYVQDGIRVQKATGVCYSDGINGVKLQCNKKGSDVNWRYYKDLSCGGDFYDTVSSVELFKSLGISSSNYTFICCTGINCKYAIQRTYVSTECKSEESYKEFVDLIGGCQGWYGDQFFAVYNCSNDVIYRQYYYINYVLLYDQCAFDGQTRLITD
eukprot:UN03800